MDSDWGNAIVGWANHAAYNPVAVSFVFFFKRYITIEPYTKEPIYIPIVTKNHSISIYLLYKYIIFHYYIFFFIFFFFGKIEYILMRFHVKLTKYLTGNALQFLRPPPVPPQFMFKCLIHRGAAVNRY